MKKITLILIILCSFLLIIGCSNSNNTTPSSTDSIHQMQKIDAVEPTCLTDGNIEYYFCSICNKYFLDANGDNQIDLSSVSVAKLNHDIKFVDTIISKCGEDCFYSHYECSRCRQAFLDEQGNQSVSLDDLAFVNNHNYVLKSTQNYCNTSNGKIDYVCDICGDTISLSIDFSLLINDDRDIKVLQLTDPQIEDSTQIREGSAFSVGNEERWSPANRENEYKKYIRQVVEKTKPDLIIVTGDLVYGRFDDDGSNFVDFIEFMDTFKTPWAPVFGNHDNESKKGVDWQCEKLEASTYCLFRQNNLTGNGNYSIGIIQNGNLLRVFYMLDSNGCSAMSNESFANGHSKKSAGFGDDQFAWLTNSIENVKKISPNTKISTAFHIQLNIFESAYTQYGYPTVPINIDTVSNKKSTDFGYLGAVLKSPWDSNNKVWNKLKELGVDSIFVGHEHANSASVLFEGVRLQYGLKSSTYDRANYLLDTGKIATSYGLAGVPQVGGSSFELNSDGEIINAQNVLYVEVEDESQYLEKDNEVSFDGFGTNTRLLMSELNGEEYLTVLSKGSGWEGTGITLSDELDKNNYLKITFYAENLNNRGIWVSIGNEAYDGFKTQNKQLVTPQDNGSWYSVVFDISSFSSVTKYGFMMNALVGSKIYVKSVETFSE